jgi:hypothetical protein
VLRFEHFYLVAPPNVSSDAPDFLIRATHAQQMMQLPPVANVVELAAAGEHSGVGQKIAAHRIRGPFGE